MNFAIANPARQVFFTAIGREEKYKAKNLIDVGGLSQLERFVRLGIRRLAGAGPQAGCHRAIALPSAAGWLALSLALGRVQEHRAAEIAGEAAKVTESTPNDTDLVDPNVGDADIRVASEGGTQ
jgi:AAA family ATP:ADP antiporter